MHDPTKRYITKIAREAETLVIHTMRDKGIGSGEFDLIHYIRHNPGSSQKEIAAGLNMDKGAVARRTARLERKGYLYRTDNPDDGRSKLLFATEKAENLKLSKAGVETVFYGWLVQELPEEEREAFLKTLDTLYWRSKRESRAGFPHVNALLNETAGVDAAVDTADLDATAGAAGVNAATVTTGAASPTGVSLAGVAADAAGTEGSNAVGGEAVPGAQSSDKGSAVPAELPIRSVIRTKKRAIRSVPSKPAERQAAEQQVAGQPADEQQIAGREA